MTNANDYSIKEIRMILGSSMKYAVVDSVKMSHLESVDFFEAQIHQEFRFFKVSVDGNCITVTTEKK